MKYLKLSLLITALIMTLSGCGLFSIYGSGNVVESQYTFEDFTSVDASYTCDVTVMQGDAFSVVVSVDDNIMPYLETYMSGNVLHIGLQQGYSYMNLDFSATIVMPELTYLAISGASSADVTGFDNSGTFRADISGASRADVAFITSAAIDCDVSGASYLKITSVSSSGDLDLECSGASTCDLRDLTLNNGEIDVSGASTSYVDISGSMDADISGASTLYYSGNPVFNGLDISGGSSLTRL